MAGMSIWLCLCKRAAVMPTLLPTGAPPVLYGWLSGSAAEPLLASLNAGSHLTLTCLLTLCNPFLLLYFKTLRQLGFLAGRYTKPSP